MTLESGGESVVEYVESVLRVADFGGGAAADDGDDVEAQGLGAVVAAHVVVGHADDVLPRPCYFCFTQMSFVVS